MSPHLNTIQKIQVFEPTYRNVLFIISKDNSAFTMMALIELHKAITNNIPNPQVAKMISIYGEILTKGYVRSDITKNKITIKGKLCLFYTSPAVTFWILILGILVAIIIGVINYTPGVKVSHPISQPARKSPTVDSPLYQKKKAKDSLKRK